MIAGELFIDPQNKWEVDRCGCITASGMDHLLVIPSRKMTEKELDDRPRGPLNGLLNKRTTVDDPTKLSDGAITYLMEKVKEGITGTMYQFDSWATDHGNEHEPRAIEALRERFPNLNYYGNENRKFIKLFPRVGGSPDGDDMPAGNTTFEIKCTPKGVIHMARLLYTDENDLRENEREIWVQIQVNMACNAKEHGRRLEDMMGMFVSYSEIFGPTEFRDQDLRLKLIPVKPDMEFMDSLVPRLELAMKKMLEIKNRVLATSKTILV